MDGKKIHAQNAALLIGTISSRIEFDSHDSVVAVACVMGETLNKTGKSIITGIASVLYIKKAITDLLES